MAYATVVEFSDSTEETYKKIFAEVGDEPIKGLIVHAAGPGAKGVRILDVWESKEDSDRFLMERLMPATTRALGEGQGGPPDGFQEFDLPWVQRG